jgi:NAD(P)-dependent dehydrogenase (short-subunit alcohol dehydrogenase family)
MNISGKVALITGASSGIGRELARILVSKHAKVALLARNEKSLEALASELSLAGAETPRAIRANDPKAALAVPADVTDRAAVDRAVSAIMTQFGRLDILVNCAGIGLFGPVETMSMENYDRVLRTNLHGPINCIQAALPALKQSRGMIVNVSSGLAMRALPFLSAYAGTKSALNALSDGMRLELAPCGIRVVNYCPPATDTGFDARSLKGPGTAGISFEGMKTAKTEDVAQDIARAISMEKLRVGGGFFRVMNALAPRMLDRMFRGMVDRMAPTTSSAPSSARESR